MLSKADKMELIAEIELKMSVMEARLKSMDQFFTREIKSLSSKQNHLVLEETRLKKLEIRSGAGHDAINDKLREIASNRKIIGDQVIRLFREKEKLTKTAADLEGIKKDYEILNSQ